MYLSNIKVEKDKEWSNGELSNRKIKNVTRWHQNILNFFFFFDSRKKNCYWVEGNSNDDDDVDDGNDCKLPVPQKKEKFWRTENGNGIV